LFFAVGGSGCTGPIWWGQFDYIPVVIGKDNNSNTVDVMNGGNMKRFVVLLPLLLYFGPSLHAQSTVIDQQISGTVTDAGGAVVPNASVVVVSEGTGLTRTVTSNSDGNYVVTDLPVGSYTVSTAVSGFKKFVLQHVEVEVGGKPSVPITLEVGEQTQTVTVEANAVAVQTATSEVGHLVTGEEATQIQLNGRNYMQLMTLAPGVSSTVASGFSLFTTYGVSGSSQSVNGNRTDTFNYNIDGVDNKDNGGGGNNFVNISPDALSEFKTVASAYSAAYGGSSGATVSVAIKSGTTSFHGGTYEYLRNRAIQAYAFQPGTTAPATPSKPQLVYNNFGGEIGGPIYIPGHFNTHKDKLFFFTAQDFKRQRTSTVTQWTVPTAQEKTGNFSAAGATNYPTGFSTGIIPACGGSVTTNCATANGLALAALFPSPNGAGVGATTGGSYTFLAPNPINTHEYLVKVDYIPSAKNQISGYFVHDYYTFLGNATNLISYDRFVPGVTTGLTWTKIINANTVNTLTGSFSGNVITETSDIFPNTLVGIKSILRSGNNLTYQTLFNASPDIPGVSVTGWTTLSSTALNFNNYERIYSIKDDLARTVGNHSLKVGISAWRSRKNQTAPGALNGSFGFTASGGTSQQNADNALANLLEGNYTSYSEQSSYSQIWARFTQIEPYVQDDWKVSRRLTVNLGLRWQYMQPQYSSLNNTSVFDPAYYVAADAPAISSSTGNIVGSNPYPYNGLVLPGNSFPKQAVGRVPDMTSPQVLALFHNLPLGDNNTDWNAWGPRIGFAYDLTGKASTVLRGGYGLSYERVEGNYIFNSVSQLPFVANVTLNNGTVDNISGGTAPANAPSEIPTSHALSLAPPRIKTWSFGVQQKLSGDTVMEVDYVGSSSADLSYDQDLNQLQPGARTANPSDAINYLRPYLGYGDILSTANGAIFNYNSLQARVTKRMRRGGTLNVSYTWAKGLTDGQSYSYLPENTYNLMGDYGPENFTRSQIFVVSYVYPLPFWRTGDQMYKKLLGGWQLSGVTNISTGLHINVIDATGTDPAGDGLAGNTGPGQPQRPNLVGSPFAVGAEKNQYLAASAFVVPTSGFGDLQAYGIKTRSFNNWDASLQKSFPITETTGFDFRAEMFNFPNHLSAFGYSTTLGSANFGQVTSATDPRTVEFALRFNF
jgi:hypothetical protein